MDYNKILVEQYFHLNGDDFSRDTKYPIEERFEKDSSINLTIEKRENKWIKYL